MATKEVIRDSKGRLVAGTAPLPGAGRPVKKRDIVDKLLDQFYGKEHSQIVLNMIEIAEYDVKADFDNTPHMYKRFFKPKWTPDHIFKARQFLFEYDNGKPSQSIEANVNTNIVNITVDLPVNIDPNDF